MATSTQNASTEPRTLTSSSLTTVVAAQRLTRLKRRIIARMLGARSSLFCFVHPWPRNSHGLMARYSSISISDICPAAPKLLLELLLQLLAGLVHAGQDHEVDAVLARDHEGLVGLKVREVRGQPRLDHVEHAQPHRVARGLDPLVVLLARQDRLGNRHTEALRKQLKELGGGRERAVRQKERVDVVRVRVGGERQTLDKLGKRAALDDRPGGLLG